MGTKYATRESVKVALDVLSTARSDAQVDSALSSAGDAVDGLTRRVFRPTVTTHSYAWPNQQRAPSWALWLDTQPDQLISATSITTGGTALAPGEFFLEPSYLGPPYSKVEINLSSNAAWNSGTATWQRSIVIAGAWGYTSEWSTQGATAEALDETETGLDVTAASSAVLGVGDLLAIDDEWMEVTGRQSVDTTVNTGAALTADYRGNAVDVPSGAAFAIGEVLTIDTERMLIGDILGNNLVVVRAYDGTTLATHDVGADIYSARTLIVQRAVRGTVASTHLTAAPVLRHDVPSLIEELARAEALHILISRRSGWARTVGSGDAETEASGRGLAALRAQVVEAFARQARKGAI